MPVARGDQALHTKQRKVHMPVWITGMKVFSWVVVALMLLAILYALGISLTHWSAISV